MPERQTELWEARLVGAGLSDAERTAYIRVEKHDIGVRELARRTNRSPGTIGNLLCRAREKLGEESQ